jgi:hypothetical protein
MFLLVVEAFTKREHLATNTSTDFGAGAGGTKLQLWTPSLVLNLDVKMPLPDDGVDLLFLRALSTMIRNGKLDLQIQILDERGELVAGGRRYFLCWVRRGVRPKRGGGMGIGLELGYRGR